MKLMTCSSVYGCGRVLPEHQFYRDTSRGRDGYMQRCKACSGLMDRYKSAKQRAATVGALDTVTFNQFTAHFQSATHCYYCAARLGDDWTVDHVISFSRSGTNTIDNLVAACPMCNARKSDKTPLQWFSELASRGIDHRDAPKYGIYQYQMPLFLTSQNSKNATGD